MFIIIHLMPIGLSSELVSVSKAAVPKTSIIEKIDSRFRANDIVFIWAVAMLVLPDIWLNSKAFRAYFLDYKTPSFYIGRVIIFDDWRTFKGALLIRVRLKI